MARKNRVQVPNGTYHVTSRLTERAHWLQDPSFKDMIVSWMHGVAEFAGVELLAWCVMDNHFHMLVHVPEVPDEYRLDSTKSPDAFAFGMRPEEWRFRRNIVSIRPKTPTPLRSACVRKSVTRRYGLPEATFRRTR